MLRLNPDSRAKRDKTHAVSTSRSEATLEGSGQLHAVAPTRFPHAQESVPMRCAGARPCGPMETQSRSRHRAHPPGEHGRDGAGTDVSPAWGHRPPRLARRGKTSNASERGAFRDEPRRRTRTPRGRAGRGRPARPRESGTRPPRSRREGARLAGSRSGCAHGAGSAGQGRK